MPIFDFRTYLSLALSKSYNIIFLSVCFTQLAAQDEATFSPERARAHVDYLASADLHGRRAGTGDERIAAEYIAKNLLAAEVPLPRDGRRLQEFSYRLGKEDLPSRSVNVVGWFEGTNQELRDQVIVIGAHFDHLGIEAGRIFPGADDNASGVAALLEIASALASHRERLGRSVAVVFFGAEEVGLLGSWAFVRHGPIDVQRVVAMVNIDMIGRPILDQASWEPWKKLVGIESRNTMGVIGASSRPLFANTVSKAAASADMRELGTQNIPFLSRIVDNLARNRSDHAPFEACGIPTLFFSSGESDDYHAPGDTADKVDGALIAHRARVIHDVLVALSTAPASEFPSIQNAARPTGDIVPTLTMSHGALTVALKDNADSPKVLSGIQSLFNSSEAPNFNAFDPDSPGAAAGLNFEHITSGHANPNSSFAPRNGRNSLVRTSATSAELVRRREDCPWDVSSTLRYELVEPHYVDFQFRCTAHDAERFGARGFATFFFANYMNDVQESSLHFRGLDAPGGEEKWIAADAPSGHPDWNKGGTYRSNEAAASEYDRDHNFRLNLWTYDYPRFTRPFYYGRAAKGMVFMLMFDRGHSNLDEIRLSLFKFKLPKKPRPAWDFQYVIHRVEENREYGFRGRLVWKKWVSPEDCLEEYERFAKSKE